MFLENNFSQQKDSNLSLKYKIKTILIEKERMKIFIKYSI